MLISGEVTDGSQVEVDRSADGLVLTPA
jgi:hypothetical protein